MKNAFHSIVTTTDKPIGLPNGRISFYQEEEINKMIQYILHTVKIERNECPYNSPLVIVKKKIGSYEVFNQSIFDTSFKIFTLSSSM